MWLFHVRCSRKNVWCCTARRNELCGNCAWVLQPSVGDLAGSTKLRVTCFGSQVDGPRRDAGTGFRGSTTTGKTPKTSGSGARLLANRAGHAALGRP